jgi:hypothetical protein
VAIEKNIDHTELFVTGSCDLVLCGKTTAAARIGI